MAKRRTLADAIKTYIDSHQRDMGPTKRQVLNTILNDYEISQRACGDITSQDIVALAQELSNGGRSPSTVHIYLSSLSSVFAIGKAAWGFDLDRTATMDAMAACSRLDPPPLKWSAPIVRKRRIRNGNQATQTGRDCHEAAAG